MARDGDRLRPEGRPPVLTGTFPIGIATEDFARTAARAVRGRAVRQLRDSLADRALIIGADRLDYSKGLVNRFLGDEHLLDNHSEINRRVTYL